MSSTKKPRVRNRKPSRKFAVPPPTDTIQADVPTLEDVRAENAKLRQRNEDLEGANARIFSDLRDLRDRANNEARAGSIHRQAFELIKYLTTNNRRFESIEVKFNPEVIVDRAQAYQATVVVVYPAGRCTFVANASDPGRAILEALARYHDETLKGGRNASNTTDLNQLFAMLDSRWEVVNRMFIPRKFFNGERQEDAPQETGEVQEQIDPDRPIGYVVNDSHGALKEIPLKKAR